MKQLLRMVSCVGIVLLGLLSTAHAALEVRLNGQAYYDTDLDITWATNANINGRHIWGDQMNWVSGLTINGVSGWRLPSADVNGDGFVVNCFGGGVVGCSDNEMGYLFWEENITANISNPFSNIQSYFYWSGTEFAPIPSVAWEFSFNDGTQFAARKIPDNFAWPVHDGDVALIPEPQTCAMLLAGLGFLGFIVNRRKCH